jgi:3-hydroxyacyl-CoA dehydrogenase
LRRKYFELTLEILFMSDLVGLTKNQDVAVITINNPPVNALSPGVAQGISDAIAAIDNDSEVKAAVLIGGGRTFIAGADIKEFGRMTSGKTQRGAGLLPLLLRIEDCRVPVTVAIHGTAFGGGLEVAMACHYRVAAPSAQVGQPEVKLGIIPGAAGTQRLPRLAGVAKAVEMCAGGNPISAQHAHEVGIIDQLISGDLLNGAIAFAREKIGQPAPKTRERNHKLGAPEQNAPVFAQARDAARKKQRGLLAPVAAIDAIEAATKLPFDQGCQVEQKLFTQCLFSDQSRALIHVFFGEREVAKIPDIPKETPIIPVQSAAVVGAGTMGGGIAMVLANAGIPVLLKDADQPALDRGLATIQKNYANSVQRGRFTQSFVDERLKLIRPTLSYDDFAAVDMVVEAVFEGMALKKQVFAELDRVCKPDAILASNTSTLNIDEIASATSRPQSVIGTHFFSPANVMRLLEIVRGKHTGKEVIATCMQLSKKLGKVGVLVGNCRGFVGNRMFHPYRREAQFLVEEGASVEAVDNALYEFGMAMGPLATGDLAGLDVGWRIRKEYRHLETPGIRQPIAEDRLCEMGRYGQKTGAGWYKYDANRRAVPDPEVAQFVRSWAAEAKIPQRQISADEIVDRCIYGLVNEGARILEEGFALRAVDIDIIYINGYGFPAHRGGPMWYADTVGLKSVYDRVHQFHEQHGEHWKPAPLLRQLAEENRTFADFGLEHAAGRLAGISEMVSRLSSEKRRITKNDRKSLDNASGKSRTSAG